MGYFLPSNYLPTYAKSLGLTNSLGSITLVLVNVASVLGCILVGAMMDRMDVTIVSFATGIAAAVAVLAVWGVSTSMAPLYVFSLLYGLTAGSYSSSWSGMIKAVQRECATADANVMCVRSPLENITAIADRFVAEIASVSLQLDEVLAQ